MIKSIIDFLVEVKGISRQKAMLWVLIPQFLVAGAGVAAATWQFAKYAAVLDAAYTDIQNIKEQQTITSFQVAFLVASVEGLTDSHIYASDNIFRAMELYSKYPINYALIERLEKDVITHQKIIIDTIKKSYKIGVIPLKRN